jgi:5-methylcytosine-specific restriction endonuclease McrA
MIVAPWSGRWVSCDAPGPAQGCGSAPPGVRRLLCHLTMPTRPPKPCCKPGCAALTTERFCPRHKREEWDRNSARRAAQKRVGGETFGVMEIGNRDGWRCGICREPIDRTIKWPHPMSASVDHVTPLALGGRHLRANVRIAHLSCNSGRKAGP